MNKFKSRKFWMAVVTAIVTVANEGLGLDIPSEAVITTAGVVIAYILGESYVDSKKL